MEQKRYTDREKDRLIETAREKILPHWASNADLAKEAKIFTAGEGSYLYDIHGRKYLDTFSSLVTSICGHCRQEIKQAVMEQMDRLEFFPNYHDSFTVPLIELADKLAELMPGDLEVSFFVSSGSEANETALKIARQYHWQNGEPHRYKVIARKYSYHGTTLGATSCTGFPPLRQCLEPLMPGVLFAPPARCCHCELELEPATCGMACLKALRKMIEWENPETVSAVIMDPIPGSNIGYPVPPDGYLQGVRDLCDEYGILLIFDEVQTGFGKTGKWFACEHWDVVPDFMSISKALTGGYLPLAVTMATKKIAETFTQKPGAEVRSGGTFGGHPLSCAAALANIAIMEKEKLVERAAELGVILRTGLEQLYQYRIVGDVRGMGSLWAVELMADRESKTPLDSDLGVGTFIRDWCWEHGMILRNNGDTLVIAPALVITQPEIDIMLGQLNEVIPLAMKKFNL